MEQQTRIASLLKEVDELRNRLTQAEERELSQKEMNQKLKETTEMEVLKLLIKQCALISYPDLLSSKPQVRSSQVNILATGSRTKDGCPPTRPLINFKTKLSPREYTFSRREGGREGKVEGLAESYGDPNTSLARGKQRKTILYCTKHKRAKNDKCFLHALNL